MTQPEKVVERGRSEAAAQTATAWIDAYRAHDVERMTSLCSTDAGFHYVPYEIEGRQRVVRGDGKARVIGKTFWASLIDAFPDLDIDAGSVVADDQGNVAMEALVRGTQARVFGPFGSLGGHFDLPHLFIFRVNEEGLIEDLSAYWDTADWYEQLGRFQDDGR
jgi:steroid delta-isomerase-like uncharacterized protein